MSERACADPIQYSVGVIEVKFRDKYPHIEKFIKDFSRGHYSDVFTEENGDGSYFIGLPITPEEIEQNPLKNFNTLLYNRTSCHFLVEGEKVNIVALITAPDEKDFQDKINEAKCVREKFLKYLEKEKIPHKPLLMLFDD